MTGGFATPEFLEFVKHEGAALRSQGLMSLATDRDQMPYHLVNVQREDIDVLGKKFLVTPICFSGGQGIDFKTELNSAQFVDSGVDGGFIQSRNDGFVEPEFVELDHHYLFIDTRTNYRIGLESDDQIFLHSLKRDSRSRVKRILRERGAFQLKSCAASETMLDDFVRLYDQTASHVGFKRPYRFTKDRWQVLLASPLWNLYLLQAQGKSIAGCVVCSLNHGFDYTFVGYDSSFPNAARAMIYFIRDELKELSSSFLDLGGGIAEGDSLAEFKRSMGGVATCFQRARFGRKCLFRDRDEARRLLQKRWP